MNLVGMLSLDELFKGRHFDREIIVLCVRWYLRYKLSFRDLVEMMAERGLSLAHTTIIVGSNAMSRNSKGAGTASLARLGCRGALTKPTSKSKAAGSISTVPSTKRERPSISCCAKRDVAAAKAFFRRAFSSQGRLPHKIT